MNTSRLIILVFLLFMLFNLNNTTDIDTIQWKVRTIKGFNKNQAINFTISSLSEEDLQSTLYIRARLTQQLKKLRLQPRIRLYSQKQKTIIICNQAGSNFDQICSIRIKNIQFLQQLNSLKLQITSLVQANISIEVYVDRKYRIKLGEDIVLYDEQIRKISGNDHSKLLLMQVPEDIEEFQSLQFSIISMLTQQPASSQDILMTISHASSIQQLKEQQQVDGIDLSSTSGIITIPKTSINPNDYILIKIKIKDSLDKYLFSSQLLVKDTQLSNDRMFNVLGLDSYSWFELKQNQHQLLLRYDISQILEQEQSLSLVIYDLNLLSDNLEQEKQDFTIHILIRNEEETDFLVYPTIQMKLTQQQKTVAHFDIPHTLLQEQRSDLSGKLYLKLSNLPSQTSFYLTLRSPQNYQFIRQQWSQLINFDTLNVNSNQNQIINNATPLTNLTNGLQFLYEDSVVVRSTSPQTKHQYYIQLNNLMSSNGDNSSQIQVSLKVNRCRSMEADGSFQCLQNKLELLNSSSNQAQNEIVVKVEHLQKQKHRIIFSFEYQLSDCPIFTYSKQYSVHKCYFNLYFQVSDNTASLKSASFIIHKLPSHIPLISSSKSHNYQSHYTLAQQSQAYFYLSIPSAQVTQPSKAVNCKSSVHLTTYFGDCILFGSRQNSYLQYGVMESQNYDIGIGGFLQINKLTESNGKFEYYVAVYCYSQSQFDLEVATNYNEEKKMFQNEIQLREGYAQEFSLRGNEGMRFVVENNSSGVKDYWVEIDELQGNVEYQLILIDNSDINNPTPISCPSQEYRQKTCKFSVSSNSRTLVRVTSKSEGLTKFIILSRSQSQSTQTQPQCHYYPSDRPQFILLQPEQNVCTRFRVTRYDDLMVSLSSLSETEMLINKVEMYVVFNQNSDKIVIEGMNKFFGKEQLRKLCQGSNPNDLIIDCQMQVIVKPVNSSPSSALIQLISFTNEQSELLNQIDHHSTINGLSKYNYKQFYYYIQSVNPQDSQSNKLTLQASSHNDQDLVIVVKVQNTERFEVSPDDYYGVYPEVQNGKRFVVKLVEGQRHVEVEIPIDILQCEGVNIHNEQSQTTHLSTQPSEMTLSPQCVLLISVFGVNQQQQPDQQFIYSIELTQFNTLAGIASIHRQSNNQLQTIFNPQTYYVPLKQIGFAKLMWIIIAIAIFCLIVCILIERLCKAISNKRKSNGDDKFSYGKNSPRIVITKPSLQDTNSSISNTSADSYGFYASPPSSSTDVIVNCYEMNRDDGIVEVEQQNSPKNKTKKAEHYPELSSPTNSN